MKAAAVVVLTFTCFAARAEAQAQDPCTQPILEASAARIILGWMDTHIALQEAMQEANAESDESTFPPAVRRVLEQMRAKQQADLEAYEGLREHALAVTEWKTEVERVCLNLAGEDAYSEELTLQEVTEHLSNFTAVGQLRLAPR